MIRLIGRKNSIAVQKVLWTSAELNLQNMERLDAGGKFGLPENYLSINPNGKVPTIIDSDGFSLWESHAICKYLVRKYAGKGKALCKYLSKICKHTHFAYFNSAIAELHYGNLLPNKFTIYPCLLDDCEPDNLNILCYNTISIDSHNNQRLYPTNDMQRVAHIDKWMDWKATTLYPHIQKLFMTMIRTAPADRDWAAYEAALKECDIKWTVVDKELLSNKKPYVCGNDLTLADMPLAICYHRWLLTADENARASFPALDDWYGRLKKESKPFKEIVIDLPLT